MSEIEKYKSSEIAYFKSIDGSIWHSDKIVQQSKAENEKLKENYRLSCLKCKFKNAFMVLDEIEEIIIKRQKEHYCYCDECSPFKEILQKIKEVKVDNG